MHSILTGFDPGLQLIDPKERPCPDGFPGWYWEIAPKMETSTGDTLIQLTGGAFDSGIGGITNTYEPTNKLSYGILTPGKIYRTEFRVKRNGVYQRLDKSAPDDFIRVGDILEFYGPSSPDQRKLYLKNVFPTGIANGLYQLVRTPDGPSIYGLQPQVDLRVVGLGFEEIAEPYGRHDTENLQEDIQLIDKATKSKEREDGYGFCGVGRICRAAANGLSRILARRRKQGPVIDIPPLNMDDGPVDDWTDPLSSRRGFRAESRPVSREASIFGPQEGDYDDLANGLFEPRVFPPSRATIFKSARVLPQEIDEILNEIDLGGNQDYGALYTLGGEGDSLAAPANDLTDDRVNEDIPDEIPALQPDIFDVEDYDNLYTPQFRNDELVVGEEQPVQAGDIEQISQVQQDGGEDVTARFPTEISPAPVQLQRLTLQREGLADKRYSIYERCVQGFLKDEYGQDDEEIMSLVDNGLGVYSIQDFRQAIREGKPAPPCPRYRQDIIDRALGQGYIVADTTEASPQSDNTSKEY
ncbi:hypothetical protein TWF730_007126 [Orbilia blumenaviensis]|uniref:Uncharacterized protein n=1 Tax=Orbilia blumenaviensis TaxID=1796055 RepID=A0AAV9VJ80_9PEZI